MYKLLDLPLAFGPTTNPRATSRHARKTSPGVFFISLFLIATNLVLLFGYLSSVNKQTLRGSEMKQLQSRLSQLEDANNKLNIKISQTANLTSIQSDFLSASFVPAGKEQFLQVNQLTLK